MATVRRRDDGLHTCLPKSIGERRLCDDCGSQKVCSFGNSEDIVVSACTAYQWKIPFRDETGLNQPTFNTLRLGKAWAGRVKEGDTVSIMGKEGEQVCVAEVLGVVVGERDKIVQAYAWGNHLLIEKAMAGEYTHESAGEWMMKKMPNLYGGLIWRNNSLCTAIGLKRLY